MNMRGRLFVSTSTFVSSLKFLKQNIQICKIGKIITATPNPPTPPHEINHWATACESSKGTIHSYQTPWQ